MFKGLGMEAFSFQFSNGVVTGPNYSFDLKGIIATLNAAEKDFYRASPQQLIHFVYENWNKTFNPQCILAGGNYNLGVTWDQQCLINTGTPNLLSAAGMAIQAAVADWGRAYLGTTTPTTPPSGGSGGSSGGDSAGSGGGGSTAENPFDFLLSTPVLLVAGGFLVLMMLRK